MYIIRLLLYQLFSLFNHGAACNFGNCISPLQLKRLQSHLAGYFQRFCNLLGPGNRRYIQTMMIITRAFLRILSDDKKLGNCTYLPCDTMTINEFLFALNIDNINLVKLLQYVKESNIIYKVFFLFSLI